MNVLSPSPASSPPPPPPRSSSPPPPPNPPPLLSPPSGAATNDSSDVRHHQLASRPNDHYMREPSHAGLSPAVVEIIAGLSAGTVATLVVHPLDIVKTRMQISQSCTSAATHNRSTVAILRSLANNPHPIASLYRGLTPNLTGNALSWASFFFFKARFEKLLASYRPGPAALPTPTDYFLASALGGALTTVLSNPIWVIKTRMLSSDRGSHGAYPSMLSGARSILRTEGLPGFYRGLGVSLIGVSHGAVQFAVYEPAKRFYFARRRRLREESSGSSSSSSSSNTKTPPADDDKHLTTEATLVISSCAKLVAGAVTYPYQVLRSRLQNYHADDRFGRGLTGVVKRTWGEEGVRGFYRGLVPGVVRVMPATWVTFLVYENVRYYLPRWTS